MIDKKRFLGPLELEDWKNDLIDRGLIHVCGYPTPDGISSPTCRQESVHGKRCYYHQKKHSGLF